MPKDTKFRLEVRRQLVHSLGILTIPVIIFFGLTASQIVLGLIVIGLFTISFLREEEDKLKKFVLIGPLYQIEKAFEKFIYKFERHRETPINGAITFYIGILLTSLVTNQTGLILAIAILAIADSASTIAGKFYGVHKIPLSNQTFEGSLIFFVIALAIAGIFAQPQKALAIAILTTLVEIAPDIDDNISIPLTVGLTFLYL